MADEVMTNGNGAENSANADVNTEANTETKAQAPESDTPKVEDLMSELAQLKADMARNKNALDKALRDHEETP